MNIWIVNPFDPLPGDPEQEGRYAALARAQAARGDRVTWWTSSFSHRFKRAVDQAAIKQACAVLGVDVVFLEAPAYTRNVSLARLKNHAALTRAFAAQAAQRPAPDVVMVSSPPPALAAAATTYGRERGVPVAVDVQDLWPDNFRNLVPGPVRPWLSPLLALMNRNARRAARTATALVGVADAYVARYVALRGATPVQTAMFPLGIDLALFDEAAAAGTDKWTKPADEVWALYSGSLSYNYDVLTIARAAARIQQRYGQRVRFFISGRGELKPQIERLIRDEGLRNLELLGFMDVPTYAALVKACDMGFNASFPQALIYLPNKVFYYLAGGLAVLNTIAGQCSDILRNGRAGSDYTAGDVEGCAATVAELVDAPARRAAMGQAARRLAETTYDRRLIAPQYAAFIASLGAAPRV